MKIRYKCFIAVLLAVYLGIYNGNLAIIDQDTGHPVEVFPYSSALYPQLDQSVLQDGIPIDNEKDYHRILEDFLS